MSNENGCKRTIKIESEATVTAPSDITVVEANISGVNATFSGAMKALARCTKEVKDAVEKAGIPREDLKSSRLTIEQNYREEKIGEDKNGNDKFRQVPDGFAYRQNITFEFPNDNIKLSRAVENITECNVEPRITFSFRCSRQEEPMQEALGKATKTARREAEIMMEAAGTKLGRLVYATKGEDDRPYMYRNDMAFERGRCEAMGVLDFDPKDQEFTQNVTMEWEIED